MKVIPAKEFENYVGQETGVTEWLEITQERINQFADATNDHQSVSYTHLTLPTTG